MWCFLKIYIRAFQHASDLDETVEEKLLIGDRPKKSPAPETKLPLCERLASRKAEELAEASSGHDLDELHTDERVAIVDCGRAWTYGLGYRSW